MGSSLSTEVAICNLALSEVVDDTITALTDATPAARKCNQYYAQARDEVLELHPWRFATKRADLIRNGAGFDVSSETSSPSAVVFRPNGRIMYVLGGTSVYEYTLTSPWDVTTATYASKSFDFSTEEATPTGIAFNLVGTKMYMVGTTDGLVEQYSLSDPWDISSATADAVTLNVGTQDATPEGIAIGNDGARLFMAGNTNNTIYSYTMTTAYDLSTASYNNQSLDVSEEITSPVSISFKSDGLKVYIAGSDTDAVHEWSLDAAWTLNSGSDDDVDFAVETVDTGMTGIAFKSDGAALYLVGTENSTVYQFGVVEWDLDTADANDPLSGYSYKFSEPSDMIRALEYAHSNLVKEPNWEEEEGFLLTNETSFPLKYIKRVTTVARFSPLCTEAIILNLGAFLAVALKGDRNLQAQLIARRNAVILEAELKDVLTGEPEEQLGSHGWTDRESI